MNYQKIYDAVIQKAKSENRIRINKSYPNYIYYENHHIIPACLNGSNEPYNRQLLTDKEHYVCHKLLTYIYKGNRKLACAFNRMTYSNKDKHIKSSRDYAYARELMRTIPVSEESKQKMSKSQKGKKHSEEQNKQHSESMKGRKQTQEEKDKRANSLKGKTRTSEQRKKMSESAKGKVFSKEHLKHLSDSHKGKIPSNKGKKQGPRSEQDKMNISKKLKGRKKPPRTKEHTQKIIESRKNNKLINKIK